MKLALFCIIYIIHIATVRGRARVDVHGVVGYDAKIPCDIKLNKDVWLISWIRRQSHNSLNKIERIYHYDLRERELINGKHYTEDNRLHFSPLLDPPQLLIEELRTDDEGIYRCEVKFLNQSPLHYESRLKIIVPPDSLSIMDSDGRLIEDKIGPFQENMTVQVACKVQGGRPEPSVTWWDGPSLLDKEVELAGNGVHTNLLNLGPLQRGDHGKTLQCQANNNDITAPLSQSVTLDVHYPPLKVEITTKQSPLVAGAEYQISCKSSFGRPAAQISWWVDGKQLLNTKENVIDSRETKVSTVMFVPMEVDKGKTLECRAKSPVVEHAPMMVQWVLDIYFSPKVVLRYLSTEEPEEGSDVEFECDVISSPASEGIQWFHKGQKIDTSTEGRVQIEGSFLRIQNVTSTDSGVYTCLATNEVGTGKSEGYVLSVQYIPVCKTENVQMLGASLNEEIAVYCNLNTSSLIQSYRWKFLSKEWSDSVDIPEDMFTTDYQTSILKHKVHSSVDFGMLYCYGSNELGEQKVPCKFNLVEATFPEQPENCTILSNFTSSSMFLSCVEGDDGGMNQTFVAEVFDMTKLVLVKNVTSSKSLFEIDELPSKTVFLLTIYSFNGRGPSEKRILQAHTSSPTELKTSKMPPIEIFPITAILGVLIGVVGALVIVSLVIFVIIRLKSKPSKQLDSESGLKHSVAQDSNGADENGVGSDKVKCMNLIQHPSLAMGPDQEGNDPSEAKEETHYAELEFGKSKKTAKKNKTKKKNKKQNDDKKKNGKNKNGEIHGSYDPTIYASIDHVKTEKQNSSPDGNSSSTNQENERETAKSLLAPPPPPPSSAPPPPSPPGILKRPVSTGTLKSTQKPTDLDKLSKDTQEPQGKEKHVRVTTPNTKEDSKFLPTSAKDKKKDSGLNDKEKEEEDIPLMDDGDDTMESSL